MSWTYITSNLNIKETVGTFYKKQLQTANQKWFRAENLINRKSQELYIKCKGYDNSLTVRLIKKHSLNE